jgi:hypothetical protein
LSRKEEKAPAREDEEPAGATTGENLMPPVNATTASEVNAPAKVAEGGNPVLLGPPETGVESGETATTQHHPHSGEVTSSAVAETGTDVGPEPSMDVSMPSAPPSSAPDDKTSSGGGGLLSRFTENFSKSG